MLMNHEIVHIWRKTPCRTSSSSRHFLAVCLQVKLQWWPRAQTSCIGLFSHDGMKRCRINSVERMPVSTKNGRRCTWRHSRNSQHNGKELPRRKWAALRLSCFLHQLHGARGIGDSVTHKHLLNFVTEYLLHQLRRDKRQSRRRWRRLASRKPSTRLCLPFFAFFAAGFFSSSSCLTSSSAANSQSSTGEGAAQAEEAEAFCSSG